MPRAAGRPCPEDASRAYSFFGPEPVHRRLPYGRQAVLGHGHARGHATDIVQLEDDYVDATRRATPGLLAVSMMSTEYVRMRSAIAKLRAALPELNILAGGPHPIFVPSCIDDLAVDGICVGEGDYAFLDVLECCEAGRDWDGIPNIHTRTSKNPPRALVEDLDTLPFPDREIVYSNSPAVGSFRLRSFLSTRGCPFMCTDCFNHAYSAMYKGLGRVVRKHSAENLLAEGELVVHTYPTDFLKFADDSLVLGVDDWLREFSAKYRERVGLPSYCLVRALACAP